MVDFITTQEEPQEEPLQSTWVLQVTNPGTLKMPKPGAAFQLLHGWFCSAKAEEEGITRHLLPALWELETDPEIFSSFSTEDGFPLGPLDGIKSLLIAETSGL